MTSLQAHDPAAEPALEPIAPMRWSLATRIAFRFGFCYLMLYALCCGNATLWEVLPFHAGEHLESWLNWPFSHGAEWLSLKTTPILALTRVPLPTKYPLQERGFHWVNEWGLER
jgi:hypothetical protein